MTKVSDRSGGSRQLGWPKWLFLGTVFLLVAFFLLSIVSLTYVARAQREQVELEDKRAAYEAKVKVLSSQLLIEKVVSETVATPVQYQKCQDIRIPVPFGKNLKHKVCQPAVRMEQREVSKTVEVADPEVQVKLDEADQELERLLKATKRTILKMEDLERVVQIARQFMAPVLSLVVAAVALAIILSRKYSAESEKWAYGTMGTILGFWFS